MIHFTKQPLPSLQSKAIRDWVTLPAAKAFKEQLAAMAAAKTAEAGNRLLDALKEPSERDEAADLIREAQAINALIEVLDAVQGNKFEFFSLQIAPKPTINPQLIESE